MADKFGQLNENDTKILLDKSVPKSTERKICKKNFFGNFACESDKFTEKYHFSLNNSLSSTCVYHRHIYSRGYGSVPNCLAVPLICSSSYSSNFEKFVKMFTTSCLLTILTNQNAHE